MSQESATQGSVHSIKTMAQILVAITPLLKYHMPFTVQVLILVRTPPALCVETTCINSAIHTLQWNDLSVQVS